jgi:hypothetical protein
MRESDKCVGVLRDMQRSRKPDRRDTDIAGFVFCLCHRCEGVCDESAQKQAGSAAGVNIVPVEVLLDTDQ